MTHVYNETIKAASTITRCLKIPLVAIRLNNHLQAKVDG